MVQFVSPRELVDNYNPATPHAYEHITGALKLAQELRRLSNEEVEELIGRLDHKNNMHRITTLGIETLSVTV